MGIRKVLDSKSDVEGHSRSLVLAPLWNCVLILYFCTVSGAKG